MPNVLTTDTRFRSGRKQIAEISCDWPRRARRWIIPITLLASSPALASEEAADCPADLSKLRYEDDWSCYRENVDTLEGIDTLKAMPLGGDDWLSVGGEIRQRYEYTHNPTFGADPQDRNGVWLQRYLLHADLRLGKHVRAFAQLASAFENGRAGGAGPVDENRLTFQNAFVELTVPAEGARFTTRVGRQELAFGSGRIIDTREGPNVRRTFDAARVMVETGAWHINALAARPRDAKPGVFDDDTSDTVSVWGLYASGGKGMAPLGQLDLYYIGYRNELARFVQGQGEERRHSLGLRIYGEDRGWDWNWEGLYQFGSFGVGDISAWTLASETGFTADKLPLRPRFALSANVASGDRNPDDPDLQTFNPLFPRGNYFSEAAVLGPRNFWNLHGFVTVRPASDVSITADLNAHWRLSRRDGVYSPAGQIIAPAGDARFIGTALSLNTEYTASERLLFTAIYSHFSAGPVIDGLAHSHDIDFFELTAQYRF